MMSNGNNACLLRSLWLMASVMYCNSLAIQISVPALIAKPKTVSSKAHQYGFRYLSKRSKVLLFGGLEGAAEGFLAEGFVESGV
jgi:hypothetical protein